MVDKKYSQVLRTIGENLKYFRNLRGYTQEGMTDFGFDYRHYQRLESGNHSISLHSIVRLSVAFKVFPHELLTPRKKTK